MKKLFLIIPFLVSNATFAHTRSGPGCEAFVTKHSSDQSTLAVNITVSAPGITPEMFQMYGIAVSQVDTHVFVGNLTAGQIQLLLSQSIVSYIAGPGDLTLK